MKPFTAIPNSIIERLPEIGQKAFVLLAYLVYRANGNGEAWPSYDTISKDTGIERHAIKPNLDRLIGLGIISVRRRYSNSTIYTISVEMRTNAPSLVQETALPLVQKSSTISAETCTLTRIREQESIKDRDRESGLLEELQGITGIMATQADIPVVIELEKQGATIDDGRAALDWWMSEGKVLHSIRALKGAIEYQVKKRVQLANARPSNGKPKQNEAWKNDFSPA